MFSTILNIYNPKDKRTNGILRLFAEELSDLERIKFVELIFEKGSWILPTEISKNSNSSEIKIISNQKFNQIFDKWVKKRIEHSQQIPINSKSPFITVELVSEFRELLISLKNLNFSEDLLLIFNELFDNCNPSYLKKFLKNSISVVIEEYNELEIELFFLYFANQYKTKKSINLANFIYLFLKQLAFSYKIHELSTNFLNELIKLKNKLYNHDYKGNYELLISIFLIDFIKNKKLDLSNSKYEKIITSVVLNLDKGDLNNLYFYKFLNQFDYQFNQFNFSIEIDIFLKKIKDNIISLNTLSEQQKKDTLYHFNKSSDEYFELFLFLLNNCKQENVENYLINFIELIDDLRKSFSELIWYNEFLNYKLITGTITSQITNGYEVLIDEDLFNKKIIELNLKSKLSSDFILHNGYGFIKRNHVKEYISTDEIKIFFITNVNYSIFNKGKIISLFPASKETNDLILKYEIKAFFSSLELYLIDKAHKYLKLESPFSKKTNSLKLITFPIFFEDYDIPIDTDLFWKNLKNKRLKLYDSIYTKHKNNEESFKKIVNAYNNNEIISGLINFRTNGGMSVDILGIEAFLPGSQIDIKAIKDYDIYLNKKMEFKILKVNLETKNIVISHKVLLEKDSENQKKELIDKLKINNIVQGIVKNITSYGVFIDLGGIDGLIHITDLCWYRINHPSEILELDQKIDVLILDFDEEKTRIQLGLKQLKANPWDIINDNFKVGDIVKGKVVTIADYGAFIEIFEGIEGLVHVSEMSWSNHSRSPHDLLKINDIVEAVILIFDKEERKLTLSIKQMTKNPWDDIQTKYPVGSKHVCFAKYYTPFGLFVELEEGVEGLIYNSDLSWNKKNKHPSEFVKLGDKVNVVVLDLKLNKISLSRKLAMENPWDLYQVNFAVGTTHRGTISSINNKGAIVNFYNEVTAFIPKTHLKKINGKKFKIGENANFKIIEFVKSKERILASHTAIFNKKI